MNLYHASNRALPIGESLRTPTGHSSTSLDVTSGGVVYMVETPAQCSRYGAYVYKIEVAGGNAVRYAEQRRRQGLPPKKSRYTRGVWVARPEYTTIRQRVDV